MASKGVTGAILVDGDPSSGTFTESSNQTGDTFRPEMRGTGLGRPECDTKLRHKAVIQEADSSQSLIL